MVSLYFGLPRCGKTTLIAKTALAESKRIARGKSRFRCVFCNVHLEGIPYVVYIKNSDIGQYDLSNGLILIDEGTLFADSRAYKTFSQDKVEFFMLHGHYGCEIRIYTQQWDGVDKKIRSITDRVFYVYKPILFGLWITKYYRIPYGIIIPDRKANKERNNQTLGEIVQGYCKPSMIQRIFCHRLFRPRYYRYFDSWEAPVLPKLPSMPELQRPARRQGIITRTVHMILQLISTLQRDQSSANTQHDNSE